MNSLIGKRVKIITPFKALQYNFDSNRIGWSQLPFLLDNCIERGIVIFENEHGEIEIDLDWKYIGIKSKHFRMTLTPSMYEIMEEKE